MELDESIQESITLEEEEAKKVYRRQYLPYWPKIHNAVINHIGKSNLIAAAVEGGSRLSRRDFNIYTAFTYGYKLQYQDLDDPYLKEKIKSFMKDKQRHQKMRKDRRANLHLNNKMKSELMKRLNSTDISHLKMTADHQQTLPGVILDNVFPSHNASRSSLTQM